MILVDSNVLVAALDADHVHHAPSDAAMRRHAKSLCVSAHALTEAYNHLSRARSGRAAFDPVDVATSLRVVTETAACVTLTHDQTINALRSFAALGGRGPRLYDYLIGLAGIFAGADIIATWNTRHFIPLFPTLRVATPQELLES